LAEQIAAEIAGPSGEVWVIAPDQERSGVSHCISYVQPTRLTELSPRRYMLDGYPADCVLVGLTKVLRDTPPDLVLSGVNRGHNVAEDVIYSGTVGGAMEGGLNRIPSIALSQYYRKAPHGPEDFWESAREFGARAVRAVLELPFPDTVFYNINFPAVSADEMQGITLCPQGMREEATFEVVDYTAPNGRNFQFLRHMVANHSAPEGSDARLLLDGWVTVTPLRPQLTADDLLASSGDRLAEAWNSAEGAAPPRAARG
ncbi:MAG TPA: 5'/3'-nucleotidase SurE, partial [Paracoccaceae bacterium]|nr:5'/3'-nucleotidase SurE [Paracoccaceae bacterium]